MPDALRPDLQQILSQLVCFVLLLVILRRFAWRPLLTILDQRRAHIEEELRQVAQRNEEAARLQQEYAQRLAAIHDEARAKIQEAIVEGKRIALEIQEQARAHAQAVVAKSKETVELELAKAKVSLRDHVVHLTMEAVERILQQKIDATADSRLIDAALEELERDRVRT